MSLIDRVIGALDQGELPIALAMEWQQDGCRAWRAEKDARRLLNLLVWVDYKAAVLAAAAVARTALRYVPKGEERPLRAIEAAEGWVAGTVTAEEVWRAAVASYVVYDSAAYAAYAAAYSNTPTGASFVASSVAHLATGPARERILARLATVVRKTVPCPTVEQLVEAVRR